MVFVLSFQMSFIAPKVPSTKFTGAVKRVLLQQSDVVTPCYYKPVDKLSLQTRWRTAETFVPLTGSHQHLLLICPLDVTLQL